MKVILHAKEDLEFRDFASPGLDIEPADPQAHFSALQMFATSLALCTYSVLAAYGEHIAVDAAGLRMRLRWSYAEDPYRIGDIAMDIHWPNVPKSRVKAAERAAAQCTLHNTLLHPPAVHTRIAR